MGKILRDSFENQNSKIYHKVSNFFALITIVSIVSLVMETVPSFSDYGKIFLIVEWVAVVFFTYEYLGRLYLSSPTRKYIFSFFGIIDLIAILPTLLGLGNFTFLKSARALRILRMLRMLRLAKVGRNKKMVDEEMSSTSLNILIYFTALVFALLVSGTAIYLVEPTVPDFSSIPAGMWWSFKVFMAGISVVEPETMLGELFFVLTRFVGLLLLGLMVGVVGNVFQTLMTGRAK